MARKKKQAKKKAAKKSVRKKLFGKAAQGRKAFVRSLADLDKRLRDLANVTAGLWQNQQSIDVAVKALAKSEESLDDQVAVLTRLFFVEANKLRTFMQLDPFDADEIEAMFEAWHEFRARADAKNWMSHWVLGKPLSELPPPPKQEFLEDDISKLQEGIDLPEDAESDGELPEGATIFGGDYGKSDIGDEEAGQSEPEDEAPGENDEVPVLQSQDEAVSESNADSSEVPEMSA
jgi:hypothetical protein